MNATTIRNFAISYALLCIASLQAQQTVNSNPHKVPVGVSEMQSQRRLHRPSATIMRQHLLKSGAAQANPPTFSAGAAPCSSPTGTRFNLEPRVNATLQGAPSADFLLNGAGVNADLIVQVANDTRGLDSSNSGYYVHRSTTGDCSVQFEGGLPPFLFQGDTMVGTNAQGGGPLVVADGTRAAFFAADGRTGSQHAGIGIFRAAAADLLNPAKCPNGTHTSSQATACWEQTPPAFVDSLPVVDEAGEPFLAVDERAAGTGSGDVYVLYGGDPGPLSIVACTNSLNCGSPAIVPIPSNTLNLPYGGVDAHVLPSGVVTLSFGMLATGLKEEALFFSTCIPAGAPNPPSCSEPVTVASLTNFLLGQTSADPIQNINFPLEITFPRHAFRLGPGNGFTVFMVYDDCLAPFTSTSGDLLCLAAEVNLTVSTDNGKTWSKPISVDAKSGHHFFGNVTADPSTGVVSIVYLGTDGDPNFHEVRVLLNQVAPGSTVPGPQKLITSVLDVVDNGALVDFFPQDLGIGAISRGTGVVGRSRLYASFNSTAVNGIYENKPLPDLNNHINLVLF